MTTPPVQVLWTSGWDSTYRVADLVLNQRQEVQPWYALDPDRASSAVELQRMLEIRDALTEMHPNARDLIRDPKQVRIADIPANPVITGAYHELARRSHLGTQYDWLARLANSHDIHLELSIHKDDKAHSFLETSVQIQNDKAVLAPTTDRALEAVFSRFSFPVFNITKLEMQRNAERDGFAHIMEMTWFCHSPLGGAPCGFCGPCRYTREEGLARRVPAATWHRKLRHKANRVRHRLTYRD